MSRAVSSVTCDRCPSDRKSGSAGMPRPISYGVFCLKKAFAIWDGNRQVVFVPRDRMGKKPLYYFHAGARLIVASEIKAFYFNDTAPPQIYSLSLPDALPI